MNSKKEWFLEANELTDAVQTVHAVQFFLKTVEVDHYFWKWVIIGLHNAVQGFMVHALVGANGFDALEDRSVQKWFEAYRNDNDTYPREKLAIFTELYARVRSEGRMKKNVFSNVLVSTPEEDRHIEALNTIRGKFSHFKPGGWILDLSGMPEIISTSTKIINFLAFKSGNIYWSNDQQHLKKTLKESLERCAIEVLRLKDKRDTFLKSEEAKS